MWSCVTVIKLISVPAEATNSVYMNLGFKPTMGSRLCYFYLLQINMDNCYTFVLFRNNLVIALLIMVCVTVVLQLVLLYFSSSHFLL